VKKDDELIAYLEWSVQGRATVLRTAVRLLRLFKRYPTVLKAQNRTTIAQNLLSVAFSLWRAAFLANRTGTRHARIEAATTFLEKMIADNAITFANDLVAREWTFNYYMTNATNSLLALPEDWNEVTSILLPKSNDKKKGSSSATRRWDRCQSAFDAAVSRFERELE
jgi:hypothetical protein